MTRQKRFDAFAQTIYGNQPTKTRAERWRSWKRTGLPVVAVILIVVVVAVITDLPSHESLAGERSQAAALVTEVNSYLEPCVYSLKTEASPVFRQWLANTLDASDRAKTPALLTDDASACSFTSDNINNLSQIEEPGTGAGKYLSLVVGIALTWSTSDALATIEDMLLFVHGQHTQAAILDLRRRDSSLASDRRQALSAMDEARRYLKGGLPNLNMPTLKVPIP